MRGRWHVCYGSGLSIIYNDSVLLLKFFSMQGAFLTVVISSGTVGRCIAPYWCELHINVHNM